MKRFLLFKGDNYYPSGGMDDFQGDFDTREEALQAAGTWDRSWQWVQIYDCQTRTGENLP
jgi:hypothetical protein